jgi:hypothetical protein
MPTGQDDIATGPSPGGRTHRHRDTWKLSQHWNGVADSLPSGSGNLEVQVGRQRLPFAHPLQPFKSVHDPIDLTVQVGLLKAYNEKVSLFPMTCCQPPMLSLFHKAFLRRRRLAEVV